MVEIFGKTYYIDLDGITDKCRTGNSIKDDDESETLEINIFKYEIIKMCLERVLSEYDETEDELGVFSQQKAGIAFKIAFNTLIKYEILIEEDEQ
jgi:hypothetical protein